MKRRQHWLTRHCIYCNYLFRTIKATKYHCNRQDCYRYWLCKKPMRYSFFITQDEAERFKATSV